MHSQKTDNRYMNERMNEASFCSVVALISMRLFYLSSYVDICERSKPFALNTIVLHE